MPEIVYRCWNDSSHLIAIKYYKKSLTNDDFSIRSYESEYAKDNKIIKFKRGSKKENAFEEYLEKAYKESLKVVKKKRFDFIKKYFANNNINISNNQIESFLKKKEKSLYSRIDRFRKKALNNKWNYFVTITYDDTKHNEKTFKEKLKKCLANLHTRYDYKYMGVFERSKTGRLHFHALMYIPKGKMRGEIKLKKDYSTSDKRMRIANINTFFEERFGRNDFIKIDSKQLMKDNTIQYLLKYIEKNEEPIFYSRGIVTFHYLKLSENDIICTFGEFIKKYVLCDDVLENEEKEIPMRC